MDNDIGYQYYREYVTNSNHNVPPPTLPPSAKLIPNVSKGIFEENENFQFSNSNIHTHVNKSSDRTDSQYVQRREYFEDAELSFILSMESNSMMENFVESNCGGARMKSRISPRYPGYLTERNSNNYEHRNPHQRYHDGIGRTYHFPKNNDNILLPDDLVLKPKSGVGNHKFADENYPSSATNFDHKIRNNLENYESSIPMKNGNFHVGQGRDIPERRCYESSENINNEKRSYAKSFKHGIDQKRGYEKPFENSNNQKRGYGILEEIEATTPAGFFALKHSNSYKKMVSEEELNQIVLNFDIEMKTMPANSLSAQESSRDHLSKQLWNLFHHYQQTSQTLQTKHYLRTKLLHELKVRN